MDMSSYQCIEINYLSLKDKHRASFRFKHKLYEWNVMLMGL